MKKEFIPGQWYKGQSNSRYIKFSRLQPQGGYNRVYYTEFINTDPFGNITHSARSDWWANTELEEYALDHPVSQEELLKILPEGHPDRVTQEYPIY